MYDSQNIKEWQPCFFIVVQYFDRRVQSWKKGEAERALIRRIIFFKMTSTIKLWRGNCIGKFCQFGRISVHLLWDGTRSLSYENHC
jgi:hypothetical protein